MPFEHGSISFRIFRLARPLPDDYIERFAAHAAPPLASAADSSTTGWVTGRHLLDRDIKDETAHHAGVLRLALLEVERKIPASLLKAECRMEELAVMAAEGKTYLKAPEKAEIKRSIEDRLRPQMPPTLKGIPFVHQPGRDTLYGTALSVKQSDLLCTRFVNTMGYSLLPCTPEFLAMDMDKGSDPRDWSPSSFSPDLDDDMMDVHPGREFLTWLLYHFDACSARVTVPDMGEVGILIEGPLVFHHEGAGAYETTLKQGEPVGSREATACLITGKKLRQAKIHLARGEQSWSFVIDADEFSFRSVKMPEVEPDLDAISQFQERMRFLNEFRDLFNAVFGTYLAQRTDAPAWGRTKAAMRAWVTSRTK